MKLRVPAALATALLLTSAGTPASSAPMSVRTIVLTVHHSQFSSSLLTAKKGEKVRFVVRNLDPIDHELIVGPMSVQIRHESGRERWHPPVPGEVSVPLFDAAATSYTFTQPGGVWFGCHLPGHWAYGMQGRITVS